MSEYRLLDELKRLRDEIEVQVHLGKAEARDEWEALEKKWEHFKGRAEVVGKAAEESADDLGEALDLLGDELKRGYSRLKKLI